MHRSLFLFFITFTACNEVVPIEVLPAPESPEVPIVEVEKTATPELEIYTVVDGDALIRIARHQGVPWQAMLRVNEEYLKVKYEEICARPAVQRFQRKHFCNPDLARPYAHTLMAGMELLIPNTEVPVVIDGIVIDIKGHKVAIVIDDSGSMSDTRQNLATWYMSAIEESGREITRVILFADNQIRDYNAAADVVFHTAGDLENICAALNHAMTFEPDAIILVADEPGDDMNGCRLDKIVPVVAHSLDRIADRSLENIAAQTGGTFVRGF